MNILLAITGSISAYKMVDLAKELNKDNSVKVLISQSAKNFLNPQIFQYFNIPVFENDFNSNGVLHIDLARWANSFVLCPATAHKISAIAGGSCEDLISSVFLSLKPEVVKIIVPAMNVEMYNNPITQVNLSKITTIVPNIYVISPDSGILACGENGEGKLPTVKALSEIIPVFTNTQANGKKVVITAGSTVVPLDSVRFISNPGRGGTSYLLAKKFLSEGYSVHVIKGKNSVKGLSFLNKHPRYSEETVTTTDDLMKVVSLRLVDGIDVYISPMAVSDLKVENASKKKLKKKDLTEIKITAAPDVLKHVVERKNNNMIIVGFAAESTLDNEIIQEKISRKPVDLLVVNEVNSGLIGEVARGFGTGFGNYKLVTPASTGEPEFLTKKVLAERIFDFVSNKLK